MHSDPIVDEIRKVRDELAARFNYDVKALGQYYRSQEKSEKWKVVLRPARLITEEHEALVTGQASKSKSD
jgi:hypothetical protein